MTTLPTEAFEYDFFADLERSLRERGRMMEQEPVIREHWKHRQPMTPLDIHMDPCSASLARAR